MTRLIPTLLTTASLALLAGCALTVALYLLMAQFGPRLGIRI